MARCWPLLLLLAPTPASAQAAMPDAAAQAKIVSVHNDFRCAMCDTPKITWDTQLAQDALDYMDTGAPCGHCPQDRNTYQCGGGSSCSPPTDDCPAGCGKGYGENMASSTPGNDLDAWERVCQMWWSEIDGYDFDDPGDQGRGPNNQGPTTGHFTQMAWIASTLIGCASNPSATGSMKTLCFYSAAGNFMGEHANNVKKCKDPQQYDLFDYTQSTTCGGAQTCDPGCCGGYCDCGYPTKTSTCPAAASCNVHDSCSSNPPPTPDTPPPTAGNVGDTPPPTAGNVADTPPPTAGNVGDTPPPTAGNVGDTPPPTAGNVGDTPPPTSQLEACNCDTANKDGNVVDLVQAKRYCAKGGTCYDRGDEACTSDEPPCIHGASPSGDTPPPTAVGDTPPPTAVGDTPPPTAVGDTQLEACNCDTANKDGNVVDLVQAKRYCAKGGTCYDRGDEACTSDEPPCIHGATPVGDTPPPTAAVGDTPPPTEGTQLGACNCDTANKDGNVVDLVQAKRYCAKGSTCYDRGDEECTSDEPPCIHGASPSGDSASPTKSGASPSGDSPSPTKSEATPQLEACNCDAANKDGNAIDLNEVPLVQGKRYCVKGSTCYDRGEDACMQGDEQPCIHGASSSGDSPSPTISEPTLSPWSSSPTKTGQTSKPSKAPKVLDTDCEDKLCKSMCAHKKKSGKCSKRKCKNSECKKAKGGVKIKCKGKIDGDWKTKIEDATLRILPWVKRAWIIVKALFSRERHAKLLQDGGEYQIDLDIPPEFNVPDDASTLIVDALTDLKDDPLWGPSTGTEIDEIAGVTDYGDGDGDGDGDGVGGPPPPPSEDGGDGMGSGAIAGIVIGVLAFLGLTVGAALFMKQKKGKGSVNFDSGAGGEGGDAAAPLANDSPSAAQPDL